MYIGKVYSNLLNKKTSWSLNSSQYHTTQRLFTCSKSAIEKLAIYKKFSIYLESLTEAISHLYPTVSVFDFKQVNVCLIR